jgi:dipeptidyl aminopeptidase/acylaminoacyl peptidase
MPRLLKPVISLLLLIVLAACAGSTLSGPIATADVPNTSERALQNRFGTVPLEPVQDSGVAGTFTAHDNGDGTTTLNIQLDQTAELYPWGIYTTGDCVSGVPENTRPIFTLPDIEGGSKEEIVETSAYAFEPGDLIVLVYSLSPDGFQQLVACAKLGAPSTQATAQLTATPPPDCTAPSAVTRKGIWLAITTARNNNSDIYLLEADAALQGGQPALERLTTDPATDFDPTWSPDGSQIAFRSQRDGNDEIYIMNSDGTCQVNLTNDPADDWSPAFSPDGTKIAFAHFFDGNQFSDIAVINKDGSGMQRLTTSHGEYPAWSPDGSQIAFASARDGNYEIYVMDADGTGQTRLTDNPAYDMSPVWSPDGTQIAFDSQRDMFPPTEVGIGPEFEIHVMNADGSGDTRLTDDIQEDRFPSWAPENRIAFSRDGALFIMQVDGSEQVELLDSGSFAAWWTSSVP